MSGFPEAWKRAERHLTNRPLPQGWSGQGAVGGIAGGEEPSKYSLSPALWNALFAALGVQGLFLPLDLPPEEDFSSFADAFLDLPGCVDLTVTNPYKTKAGEYLLGGAAALRGIEVSRRVRDLGCLNHIMRTKRGWLADNTDGAGLVRAIGKRRKIAGLRILLVGAGGAAASAAYELLAEGASLVVANIVEDDARRLADRSRAFGLPGRLSDAGGWGLIAAEAPRSDCVISAITSGTPLSAEEAARLDEGTLFVDIRYGKAAEFAEAVRAAGRPAADGREMLFGQFALAAAGVFGGGSPEEAARLAGALETIENSFYL